MEVYGEGLRSAVAENRLKKRFVYIAELFPNKNKDCIFVAICKLNILYYVIVKPKISGIDCHIQSI